MTEAMRAVVISEPGGVDKLVVKDVFVPRPQLGWVPILCEGVTLGCALRHKRSAD